MKRITIKQLCVLLSNKEFSYFNWIISNDRNTELEGKLKELFWYDEVSY